MFGKPHFWGFLGELLKAFREIKLHLQLNNFTQNKISMIWGLGEKEGTKFMNKKGNKGKKRKRKKIIAAISGLVGMKGHLKTHNQMKYFLPYFCRFWLRLLFRPNFWEGFWVLKPKSRDLLPEIYYKHTTIGVDFLLIKQIPRGRNVFVKLG